MNQKSKSGSSRLILSEKTYSDDGQAAFERERRAYRNTLDHKDNQILRKYERALSLIFSGALNNPKLSNLTFNQVCFYNKRDYLLVELLSNENDAAIQGELAQAEGHLRSLLASSLNKKRVPRIKFILLEPGEHRRSNHAN